MPWADTVGSSVDRLLRSVVLAVLHVFAGECDGRMSRRSVALLHEAIGLLLYPHVLSNLHQPVPLRYEVKAASPVRHRGSCTPTFDDTYILCTLFCQKYT